MSAGSIDLLIIAPALLAGVLVLLTHVPLGARVLQRGIVFIDLAIAQIAALGVIVAGFAGLDPEGWMVQVAAGIAALSGALLLTWTEKKMAAGAGSANRRAVRAGGNRQHAAAGRQSAWQRT